MIGIKISKSGRNVLITGDPNLLTFSSEYGTLRYYKSGEISVTCGDNATAESIVQHELGYTPFFIVYAINHPFPGSASIIPWRFGDAGFVINLSAYADKHNLYFQYTRVNGAGLATVTFNYKVFKNNTGL